LTAALAVLAFAGCGGSSGPTPVQVGEQWYRATAAGDAKKLCQISTAARRRRFIELGKLHVPRGKGAPRTCAGAVALTLEYYGGTARLGKLAHVHIRLLARSKAAAEVQAENAAPLKLVRSGSTWLVDGANGR